MLKLQSPASKYHDMDSTCTFYTIRKKVVSTSVVSTEHEGERHQGYLEPFDPNSWCNMPAIHKKKVQRFYIFF